MQDITHDNDPMAMRLAIAVKRLRARLQDVAMASSTGVSIAQIAILQRLRADGPTTAAALALAEHVSQQAIAQNLSALKRAGMVEATPDAQDGRKSLLSVTDAGHRLFATARATRNAWLERAIESTIAPEELPALDKAIELMERLANADR